MAHVATWKKDLVSELVQDMREAPVVAVVDMESIPGQQIQAMRATLRAHAKLKMTKNKLMLLALEEASADKPGQNSHIGVSQYFQYSRMSPGTTSPKAVSYATESPFAWAISAMCP